ncbi:hypothetical protein [Robiginitalea sp. SC105]|uniref:HYC_CC_PP family protein n=1 Tax=Robiginitalea sp. SC105 TaxID=2762332 RepID=UPI00163AC863|nr:hypothetical protein [Robiginitalea sp. SC105]MBC2839337.1 hypothetical protein [Robiginitalea sp. SC105]
MKPLAHKSGAVLLAFLLLFSTLSFSMDMHFCGKTLVDFKLYHKAEGCGMAMDDSATTESGCCNDVEIVVVGQDDLDSAKADTHTGQIEVLATFIASGFPFLLQLEPRSAELPYEAYSPPRLVRDIPVRHQVFLI